MCGPFQTISAALEPFAGPGAGLMGRSVSIPPLWLTAWQRCKQQQGKKATTRWKKSGIWPKSSWDRPGLRPQRNGNSHQILLSFHEQYPWSRLLTHEPMSTHRVLGNGHRIPAFLMTIQQKSVLFGKHGIENRDEEKAELSLSSKQRYQCTAAKGQPAPRWSPPGCGSPHQSKFSPTQAQNRCVNPARTALLAADRTTSKAEWQAVEQMFTPGSNYSRAVVHRLAF